MADQFRDWLTCPGCGASDEVSVLAHDTELSLECHDCGQTAEYTVGEEVPLNGLDPDAMSDAAEDQL